MHVINLNPRNHAHVLARFTDQQWCIACLCAAWCDVCEEFRPVFDALAERYPEVLLLWVDIEDEADVVADFDVENFPTILIQQGSHVAFFGPVEPGFSGLTRLINAQVARCGSTSAEQLHRMQPDLQQALRRSVLDC
ncbi:MAG: hypothetical protein NVSMB6_06550 [Burkholderiaceae bacterium]